MDSRDRQYWKAFRPMEVSLLAPSNVTDFRFVQPLKALSPIDCTDSGMTMEVMSSLPAKAPAPI